MNDFIVKKLIVGLWTDALWQHVEVAHRHLVTYTCFGRDRSKETVPLFLPRTAGKGPSGGR
jgi:hypothetical protein